MIPTAETFLNKYKFKAGEYIGNSDFDTMALYAKEFAKLHVEAALKSAWENAEIKQDIFSESGEPIYEINHLTILNAYPLENIK
jgi:hypothetical protein